MKLDNRTNLPGAMLVASTSDNEQTAMLACKVTYRLDERNALSPVPSEEMWEIVSGPALLQGVTLMPDLEYRKQGIDLIVFGSAHAPESKPVKQSQLRITCGQLDHRVIVFGNRVWQRTSDGLTISEAQPFVEMPITNDRAFGGQAKLENMPMDHAVNPKGKGFCLNKKDAEGVALPNLERPDMLIRSWEDNPTPACLYKPQGPLLDATGPGSFKAIAESKDPMALSRVVLPRAFHQAVPGLICPSGGLGKELVLTGFDPRGDVVFPLPPERSTPGEWGPVVHASVGDKRSRFAMSISSIVVFVPQRALVVTYAACFRYLMIPEQLRSCVMTWTGPVAQAPITPQRRSQLVGSA